MNRSRDCIVSALCILIAFVVFVYYDFGSSVSSGLEETAIALNVGAESHENGYFKILPLLSIALAVVSLGFLIRCIRKRRMP